jgi:pimeloyl-ACP methyl ester carboxylesterase
VTAPTPESLRLRTDHRRSASRPRRGGGSGNGPSILRYLSRFHAALFCDKRLADRIGTTGVGYYAHYLPQLHPDSADVPLHLDRLAMIKVPVLVIKPACDYLAWSAVVGYRRAFPQAQLVMIPDAGHVAYLEQPVVYTNLERAFWPARNCRCRQLMGRPSLTATGAPVRDFSSRECCE